LECPHADHAALFQTLRNDLTQIVQQLHLHPCVFTALWLGMTAIRNDTPYPDIIDELLPQLRTPVLQQTRLGWEQLYHSQLSKGWAAAINLIHPQLPQTGEQVLVTIQKCVWRYILGTWLTRNQHLHHQAATLNLPNYRQAATTLYEQCHNLSPTAQATLYRYSLEEVLALPAPRLEQWVLRGYKYYNQQLKAAKYQAILNTQDIRHFFGPLAQQSDDLHPPRKPCYTAHVWVFFVCIRHREITL